MIEVIGEAAALATFAGFVLLVTEARERRTRSKPLRRPERPACRIMGRDFPWDWARDRASAL